MSASPDPTLLDRATHGNALPVGFRLHEFEITGLLGEGGFGIVYTAFDTQLQRHVAIKEFLPSSLAYRDRDGHIHAHATQQGDTFALGMRSFINEARLLAAFDHPALIKVHRFGEALGTAFMVMPWCKGPTLKAWLQAHPHEVTEDWLRALLPSLLDALSTLHAQQCFHRDIAPDNILLLAPDRPVLLDFGAARQVIGDATQAMTVILKPGYAPIEQYADVAAMKQGPWTDVYALCAVLYRAVTGITPPASVARMLNDECVSAATLAAGRFSPGFLAAIDQGLSLHPSKRPASMAALRQLLGLDAPARPQALPASPAPPARSATPAPAAPTPQPKPPLPAQAATMAQPSRLPATATAPAPAPARTWTTALVAAGSLGVVALALVAWWASRPPSASVGAPAAPAAAPATQAYPAPLRPTPAAAPETALARPATTPPPASAAASPVRQGGLILSVDGPTERTLPPPPVTKPVSNPAPTTRAPVHPPSARGGQVRGERCGDILQKASLEPLNSEETHYLQKECQ